MYYICIDILATSILQLGGRNQYTSVIICIQSPRALSACFVSRTAIASHIQRTFSAHSVDTNRTLRCVKLFYCSSRSMFITIIIQANIQGTFRAHWVHIQGKFSAHSGNIQHTRSSENVQCTFRVHPAHIHCTLGNIQSTLFREHSVHIQWVPIGRLNV